MPALKPRLLVTGAGGQLGRLVVEHLLQLVPATQIIATVRNADSASGLAEFGVDVRIADYNRPETLDAALAGVDRVLLVSSSALGQRVAQHRAVIEAASRAGVGLLAYTSVLQADTSPLGLAGEHRETEDILRASGLPFVLLRNGWYTENYTASIPPALAHNTFLGSAGEGRISSAARADYAAAAAAVLTTNEDWNGRVFELAGDEAYTLAEFAREVAHQSGKPVVYANLLEAEYCTALLGAGLPKEMATLLADCDAGAAKGALFDNGQQLRAMIGRPTTPMVTSIAAALTQN